VLLSRGPDAVLSRGETLDMVLDRDLTFAATDLENIGANAQRRMMSDGPGPAPSQKDQRQGLPIPGRRLPL
jgi:hypothetical protein